MKKIVVSAPGKVHLMGEHAVVYGKPALLTAISLRVSVSITAGGDGQSTDSIYVEAPDGADYVRYAADMALRELHISAPPRMHIRVSSRIPAGYHLGSSAAVAVATVGAVMYFCTKLWNPERINQIAYEAEKKQHGNPSGGDNTAVTFGGLLWYRKELEFLRSMWQMPFKINANLHHFTLINTGRPLESTGEMVAWVRSKVKHQKAKMEKIFHQNEEQVKRLTVSLKEGNEKQLIDATRLGERTLEGMGVVSKKICPMIRTIEQSGGAAKALGGGGKKGPVGFLLCYHHDQHVIERLSKSYGYAVQAIRLGEEGVRLENKS